MSPAFGSAMPTTRALGSGVTAIVFDEPAVGSVDVRGGGPGTRETALLEPDRIRSSVSTPSCCPAARPSASMPAPACRPGCASRAAALRIGERAGADRAGRDPVRPAQWRRQELGPLPALSRARLRGRRAARGADFALGSVGAGLGATTVNLKGGLGSASADDAATASRSARWSWSMPSAASRSATARISGRRRSSSDGEFGGRGWPATLPPDALALRAQGPAAREHHPGPRRHRRRADQGAGQAPRDHGAGRLGARDLSGAYAARRRHRVRRRDRAAAAPRRGLGLTELGAVAANVLARAIARGVYEAKAPAALAAHRSSSRVRLCIRKLIVQRPNRCRRWSDFRTANWRTHKPRDLKRI